MRGEYWSARWICAYGTDGEQGGFLTQEDADIYTTEQKVEEKETQRRKFY